MAKRKKRRKPPAVEPGNWILDLPGGMPPMLPPDPLPAGLVETEIIEEQVNHEGLGFCVLTLIPPERVEDQKLKVLWEKTKKSMRAIQRYLIEDREARKLRDRLESFATSTE